MIEYTIKAGLGLHSFLNHFDETIQPTQTVHTRADVRWENGAMAFSDFFGLAVACVFGVLAMYLADNEFARTHHWLIPLLWSACGVSALLAVSRTRWFRALLVPQEAPASPEAMKQEIHDSPVAGDVRMAGRDYHETRVYVEPVSQARLAEFEQIENFLVKKDEMQLRETFDFPAMLKFNIRLARNFYWPGSVPPREMEEMAEFFKDGAGLIYKPFLDMHTVGDSRYMKGKPGKLYLANTSKTCVDARAVLSSLSSSSKLPLPVVDALNDFSNTVSYNADLFVISLSESFARNQRNIRDNNDTGSDRHSAAWNYYWGSFSHLKPKAIAISVAIRSALENK